MTLCYLSGMVFTIVFSCSYSTFLKNRFSIFDFWLQSSVIKTHRLKFLHVLFCLSRGQCLDFNRRLSSQLRTDFFIKKILKMEEVDLSFCERSCFLAFRVFYHQIFVLFLVKVTTHISMIWYFFPWYTSGIYLWDKLLHRQVLWGY